MSLNHQEFLKRIKKSLYYGPSNPDRMTSMPLATHVSKVYSETHRNYSLNNLDLDTISKIRQQTPCNLILALIYLERLNALDPQFVKLVSPSELFLVILVSSMTFKWNQAISETVSQSTDGFNEVLQRSRRAGRVCKCLGWRRRSWRQETCAAGNKISQRDSIQPACEWKWIPREA